MKSESHISEAKLAANRANAQLSSGPRTAAGKAVSSMNAVKTGLTGRTVLLPSDDAEAYRNLLAAYENEFKPVGLRECELVQSLADIQWRLQRIPGLEMAIYARGRDEFAEQFEDLDPAARSARLDLETFILSKAVTQSAASGRTPPASARKGHSGTPRTPTGTP